MNKPGALLSVLEEVQKISPHTYLNEYSLSYIATHMHLPLSQVYSVVTFYSFFNLTPQGKHTITICRGTACHTRGSKPLLEDVLRTLGLQDKTDSEGASLYTTEDMEFTVRTVACFGQCALAPVIAIDNIIYSRMTTKKVIELVRGFKKKAGI
jgi:NADH-quinone oxidoreductase subunit E